VINLKPRYKIRFWFEWRGGCFWSANKEALERFGYPICPERLPLSPETVARAKELGAWHDTALNWDYPPDPGPWRQEECDRFNSAAKEFFEVVSEELGDEFELVNEQDEINEHPDLDEYLMNPNAYHQ
jgi:hypothetical protein